MKLRYAVLLSVTVLTVIFTISAFDEEPSSAESIRVGNIIYDLNTGYNTSTVTSIDESAVVANIQSPIVDGVTYDVTGISFDLGSVDNTTLKTIYIPSTLKNIGFLTYDHYAALESFIVNKDNQYFSSEDGVLFNKSGDTLLRYPSKNCNTDYKIPSTVKTIADSAFSSSSVNKITIPNNVSLIGQNAFSGCTKLSEITLYNKNVQLGTGSFALGTKYISVNCTVYCDYENVFSKVDNKYTTFYYEPLPDEKDNSSNDGNNDTTTSENNSNESNNNNALLIVILVVVIVVLLAIIAYLLVKKKK